MGHNPGDIPMKHLINTISNLAFVAGLAVWNFSAPLLAIIVVACVVNQIINR